MTDNGSQPTKEQFSKQVDSTFRASAPEIAEFELRLVEYNEIADSESHESFSLVFVAPGDTAPAQMTYTLSNPELGTTDVFLVPLKRDENGSYLEAIFNRFKT